MTSVTVSRPPAAVRGRLAGYGAVVFLSSAVVMLLEIVAGRLVAPYVGASLYTWTSIIGVVLAGLSLGNWLGGVWADRGAGPRTAGVVLGAGGILALAVLLVLTAVAPVLQRYSLDLLTMSFLLVASLFFAPAALLGILTPLLTTLALRLDTRTGHVVGRMHALAALGSIAGTFLTGYWLIQFFGTRLVIIGAAGALLLLALPFLWGAWRTLGALALLSVGVAWTTHAREGFANPCDEESAYFCIRVVDDSLNAPFGEVRTLVLDHLEHSSNHAAEPRMLLAPYVHLSDELARAQFGDRYPGLRYFFGGGGAYTQPRAVRAAAPAATLTVAELDPAVTRTAIDHLFFEPDGVEVVHGDARVALRSMANRRFDVVVTDVFHDITIPHHLLTREFAELVESRLAADGLYLINVVDALPDPRLVKSVVKTLGTRFPAVQVWLPRGVAAPGRTTFVIAAGHRLRLPQVLSASRGFRRQWREATPQLMEVGTPLAALPVLSDDFAPVDRLLAAVTLSGHAR